MKLLEAKILNPFHSKVPKGFYGPPTFHSGVDLSFANEKIYAPCGLTILKNNVQNQMGNVLYARNEVDKCILVFAHLLKFLHKVGDKVVTGQALAISGNSGVRTTGAHLHVEVLAPPGTDNRYPRKLLPFGGDNIDPIEYLKKLEPPPKNEDNGGWIGALRKVIPFPRWLFPK